METKGPITILVVGIVSIIVLLFAIVIVLNPNIAPSPNIITLFAGLIVLLFGIVAILNPNVARWINAPGGPRLKALIALIVGIILIIVSLIVEFPTN